MYLVQVSDKNSDPVVCKILDYGKHIFEKKKSNASSKSKIKRGLLKRLNLDHLLMSRLHIKLKKLKALLLTEIRLK